MMFELGYVTPEEVPQIPRLARAPKAVLYAPLGEVRALPDVVLVACKPAGAMLLQEAASRVGVGMGLPTMGRRRAWRCPQRCSMEP